MAGDACAMSQSSGNFTGPGGGGGGAGATGGVSGMDGVVEAGESADGEEVGLFGGNGKVTLGLAELAVGPGGRTATPDGTPRRTAGKHSRFARAR